ncbi:MAG: hypothetical protein V4497_11070 [Bacteroidota bacterium]
MNSKKILVLLSLAGLLMACSNDNSDSLMNDTPIMGVATYKQNVKSIIDNNCIVCHATVPKNGAPMSLVTYDQVKSAVQNRGLLTRISLENGNSSLMPQGGPRLPQATIDVIVKWNQDGLLEQ